MWIIKCSYFLVAAFILQASCNTKRVHEMKDWTECQFASSCICKNMHDSEELQADCSNKNLLRIPTLQNNLQDLSLRNNAISLIKEGIFEGNHLLKFLDLSFNRISNIRKNTFKGLKNLLSLDLSANNLKYENMSFESSAFQFLENLKILNMKNNFHTSFLPDLWRLRTLESLSIDYISDKIAVLTENFIYLNHLRSLDLSGSTGNCTMNILTQATFLSLSQITHINLSKCKIQYIYKGTFESMKNISELDVSFNTCLRFAVLENITTDLQYTAIKILKVNYIHSTFEMSTILKTSHIRNLRNTSLARFEAAGNRIQRVEYGAAKYFPKSFESINVRDNAFSFGKYLFELVRLQITSLDISEISSSHNVLTCYMETCDSQSDTFTMNSENNWLSYLRSRFDFKRKKFDHFVARLPVPRKLRKLSLTSSKMKFEIPKFGFITNELTNLNFSDNILHTWTGPITNVNNMTVLDLSSNFCSNVSKIFFSEDFINLRYLLLQNNLLGLILPMDVDGEIFQNLHNVVHINLSKNKIANIPNLLFKKQQNLERLDLSENMIDDINFKLSHLRKLMFLNLRNNRISRLSKYAMNGLDSIAKMNTNLTIDLSGNNLVCNCDSLSFVKWIIDTSTYLRHREEYECKTSQNPISLLRNPKEVYQTIQKECMSYEGLIIGLTTGILMFIFILCGGIVYRYRWKLRYLYYMVKVKWHDPEHKSVNKDERLYMYDAFVSYANEDHTFVHTTLLHKLEKNSGIQLCLHRRNFLPGNDIATNITSAIHNSRKTIVIMSSNYLASYWCMFEYNMAKMESIYERNCENILFLVFYEQIPACDLPLQILELVHCQSYIEYPNDEYGDVVFWEQLQRAIKSH
ncbi:toll-like receptor 4 [Mytilus californianus]|uniref:toll-like receptor 4 n=1 Tax=Mytilus californianus TaxID=6549 RepID=UPI0022451888|nr:toll-like receptor 4 [Mytilus californianus]